MGDIPAFHATNRLGGGFRGALRRRVQFQRRAAWRRSADRGQRHRPPLVGEDDDRQGRMGRGMHHGAARLGECHAIWHGDNLREALDDIVWRHTADEDHRPVRVPSRLFSVRDAGHIRDAPQTDRFGGFHTRFERPDGEVAGVHGASER